MKKLVTSVVFILFSMAIRAQVPEKKKDSPAPSRGQERAINEIGVSVKSKPAKSSGTKNARPAATKEEKKKKEQKTTEAKKPE